MQPLGRLPEPDGELIGKLKSGINWKDDLRPKQRKCHHLTVAVVNLRGQLKTPKKTPKVAEVY